VVLACHGRDGLPAKRIVDTIFEWAGDWHECRVKGAQHGLADNTGSKMRDDVCRPSARCGGKSRGCANLGFCHLRFVGGGGFERDGFSPYCG